MELGRATVEVLRSFIFILCCILFDNMVLVLALALDRRHFKDSAVAHKFLSLNFASIKYPDFHHFEVS